MTVDELREGHNWAWNEAYKTKNIIKRLSGSRSFLHYAIGANIAYKILTYFSDAQSGSIIIGTRQPVILSSRSDSVQVKLNSIILSFIS